MRKYMLIVLLFMGTLQAATIQTQSPNIDANTRVMVSVTEMPGAEHDWVAIFPAEARSTFANIVSYRYINGAIAGDFDLGTVPAGNYEARAFASNTWHASATYAFSVIGVAINPTVTSTKDIFNTNEAVTVSISNMQGDNHDWIAIFPIGVANTFANIVSYRYTNGMVEGDLNLGTIPAGNYEVRAFYANSWKPQVSHAFSVEGADITPIITTDKETYISTETISVSVTNMPGDGRDWVAIFPVGAASTFANIISYKYTNGMESGSLNLGIIPVGDYEVRAFFANSWRVQANYAFSVTKDNHPIIFIIGDSTVHNTSDGEMGWGTGMKSLLINQSSIYNQARSGASSTTYKKSHYTHRDWNSTKSLIEDTDISHGAYLFIQFGHNDEHLDLEQHTEPGRFNSFYNTLKSYVDAARTLGVTPVLITPVERMYKGIYTHGEYPQTVRYLAEDEGVLLLDLQMKSHKVFDEYESTQAILDVFHYDDNTHFKPEGAQIVAGWIKELVCHKDANLCALFK